jgi:glycosyltransferase involved in cell wall biosynthesis
VATDGDRDGLPTVLLESMALGTPVVATDVVGIPEIVRDGVTGRLVPQRDASALADALQALLTSAEQRTAISRGARDLIEREFDVSRNAETLRALFHRRARARVMARAS